MNHVRKLLFIVFALLLLTVPAFAQDTNWFIYLFDSNANALIRVNADGSSAEHSLGLPQGHYIASVLQAFDSTGTRVAFCSVDNTQQNQSLYTLHVRDIASETDLLTMPFGAVQGCSVSAFSPDGMQIAASIVNRTYMMEPTSPDEPEWRLLLLNAADGTVLRELNDFNPQMPVFSPWGERIPLMPIVETFGSDSIEFIGLPFIGMDGPPALPAYRWSLSDDSIAELGNRSLVGDRLAATGETVTPQMDESQPAAMPMGPLPQANVLVLEDASGPRVIYRNSEWVIMGARFINNGQQIAVKLLSGFDENNPNDTSHVRFVAVDRSGAVTDLGSETMSVSEVVPAPDGAVWFWVDYDATAINQPPPTSHAEYFDGSSLTPVWSYQQPAGEALSFYQPIWWQPVVPAADLQPFPAAQ